VILYRTLDGIFVEEHGKYYGIDETSLDALVCHDDLPRIPFFCSRRGHSNGSVRREESTGPDRPSGGLGLRSHLLPEPPTPASKSPRTQAVATFTIASTQQERPELFFKAMAHKVAGPSAQVRIRRDATWSVPEPELTLLVNPRAQIIGYTMARYELARISKGRTRSIYRRQRSTTRAARSGRAF